jgi:hypothetical protein
MLVICCAAPTAEAQQPRQPRPSPAQTAAIECAKQLGARYDAQRRMWIMETDERYATFKDQAFRDCVARRTRGPRGTVNLPTVYLD